MAFERPLVIIHGMWGRPQEMAPLAERLAAPGPVLMPTLIAHERRPVPEERLRFAALVDDVHEQARAAGIESAHVIGYSLGGYIALYLARHRPDFVASLVSIAGKIEYGEKSLAHILGLLSPERAEANIKPRAPDQYEIVMENIGIRMARTAELFEEITREPPLDHGELKRIATPALVCTGEEDRFMKGAEARRIAASLRCAQPVTWAGRSHPFETVPLATLAPIIRLFFAQCEAGSYRPPEGGGEQLRLKAKGEAPAAQSPEAMVDAPGLEPGTR